VVAGHAARLPEVLDAVRIEDVGALAGAGPQPAVAVLAEQVDARVLQAVGGVDVLHRAQALRGGAEAGEADRLAVGDTDIARAPLEKVGGAIVAQAVGGGQPAPAAVLLADREAELAGGPDPAGAVLDHVAEPLLDAAAGDRDGDEAAALEPEEAAAVGAHQQLVAAGGEEGQHLAGPDREAVDRPLRDAEKLRRAAAHPERAVPELRHRADGVALGAPHQLEPRAGGADQAAVGPDVERALPVAPLGPHHLARQPLARRVDAPQ